MTDRLTWQGPRALLEEAERALSELMDPPVEATSLLKSETKNTHWVLHAYTDLIIAERMMALLPPGLGLPERKVLEERDWVAHALEGLGVVRAGPFVLFGSHDAAKVQDEDGIKLQIEANQAFGTGHHPTTAGCLEALGNLPMQPNNILDLGCGSGVLAMASRCLWPEASVTATDIDGQSIKIAQENAKINGLDSITFDIASGTQSVPIQEMAPFDLIIANILAGPLKELAPDIVAVAAQPCFILLAGLLDEQQASVIEVYRNLGFQLTAATGTPRWPILTLSTQKE